MYFDFLTFSDNLFNSSHFYISFSSLIFTCETDTILSGVICSSLKEQRELVKFVSSANGLDGNVYKLCEYHSYK